MQGYSTSAATNSCFVPYNDALLAKLVASLNAYHGHLKHAASYRTWQRLNHRYSWLVHYVLRRSSGVFVLRYPPWKLTHSCARQRSMARFRFPAEYAVLLQIGSWWQQLYPEARAHALAQPKHYIHGARVHTYALKLASSRHTSRRYFPDWQACHYYI
jgi:hypothetical protein